MTSKKKITLNISLENWRAERDKGQDVVGMFSSCVSVCRRAENICTLITTVSSQWTDVLTRVQTVKWSPVS